MKKIAEKIRMETGMKGIIVLGFPESEGEIIYSGDGQMPLGLAAIHLGATFLDNAVKKHDVPELGLMEFGTYLAVKIVEEANERIIEKMEE